MTRQVSIAAGHAHIQGDLTLPQERCGAVLFAHGSGSSRHSSRNQYVARELNARGLATLLIDLLTAEEEEEQDLRFDIGLLADRLRVATEWLEQDSETSMLPIGYFGASTGAAAALAASVHFPSRVRAVVSRGGRPDLAGDALPRVSAPTLLIVGSKDFQVIELNNAASYQLEAPQETAIVEGATHLFEEPGTLQEVAKLAGDWFVRHLCGGRG
jgi:pimeloyl-ACP methyl ester carboxylesterase